MKYLIQYCIAGFLLTCIIPISVADTYCHGITDSSNMLEIEGFAPPYNVLSEKQELLVKISCDTDNNTEDVTVGTGNNLQYIYRLGYIWEDNSWNPVSLAGPEKVEGSNNDWYRGFALGSFSTEGFTANQGRYFVAYVCTWDTNEERWKCGCSGPSCDNSRWQLQTFRDKNYLYVCPPQLTNNKNLVLITHGWKSNIDTWVTTMSDAIRKQIKKAEEEKRLNPPDTGWDVCGYDWRDKAKTPGVIQGPSAAWLNAEEEGKKLADKLHEDYEYEHIHFIAHSAGSNLIDTAARTLRLNETNSASVTIHSTFLDAYDPSIVTDSGNDDSNSQYGQYSDWAEHYVDMRPVKWTRLTGEFVDYTRIILPEAYNFDVTKIDTDDEDPHSWPYIWYIQTIENSSNSDKSRSGLDTPGFGLSIESGRNSLPDHNSFPPGESCDLGRVGWKLCPNID